MSVRRYLAIKGTHYAIARYAIEHGLHVLVTKPATQLLEHHLDLIDMSRKHNVVCFVEHHKRSVALHDEILLMYMTILWSRYDPVYSDARVRARALGEFNFFNAWMSQPKSQLETFRAWAGKDSDIRQVRWGWGHEATLIKTAAIIYHLTISIFVVGSCKTRPFLPVS